MQSFWTLKQVVHIVTAITKRIFFSFSDWMILIVINASVLNCRGECSSEVLRASVLVK
jgi:hypothetical protein